MRWTARATQLRARLADPSRLATGILDALLAAGDVELEMAYRHLVRHVRGFFAGENEGLACGAVLFIGTLGLDPCVADLGLPAQRAMERDRYESERSLRLANACVRALVATGSEAALRQLIVLRFATRHRAVLREIDRCVEALGAT